MTILKWIAFLLVALYCAGLVVLFVRFLPCADRVGDRATGMTAQRP